MPHEYLGFEKDNFAGLLLSIEMVANANREQTRAMKSNKGKQNARRGRMHGKQPHHRRH